jgi:O-acetyl-ADP-ribose deacetylase (regulator of RNase III)
MEERFINNTKLVLSQGDITQANTQAIVNAANSRLAGGGGVDGAIHRAGGPEIMQQCRKIGGCPTGAAVITTAGSLPADKVIHTVGPVYSGKPRDAELLASCYQKSLDLAAENGLRTIAFPSISTGAYGYPLDQAAEVALEAVKEAVSRNPEAFDEVWFVLFGPEAFSAFQRALNKIF